MWYTLVVDNPFLEDEKMILTLSLSVILGFFVVTATGFIVGLERSAYDSIQSKTFGSLLILNLLTIVVLTPFCIMGKIESNYVARCEAELTGKWLVLREFISDTKNSTTELAGMEDFKDKFGCPDGLTSEGFGLLSADVNAKRETFNELFKECVVIPEFDWGTE